MIWDRTCHPQQNSQYYHNNCENLASTIYYAYEGKLCFIKNMWTTDNKNLWMNTGKEALDVTDQSWNFNLRNLRLLSAGIVMPLLCQSLPARLCCSIWQKLVIFIVMTLITSNLSLKLLIPSKVMCKILQHINELTHAYLEKFCKKCLPKLSVFRTDIQH
jgi:hypothetical protein